MSFLNVIGARRAHNIAGFHHGARGPTVSKIEEFLTGKRCLVVDDEFLIAVDLQEILEAAGASVTAVANASEALAAMHETAFDFAILDLTLGSDTDGSLTVAAKLTAQKIPVVFLTGMRRDAMNDTGYRDVPLVEKPYQTPLLMAAIRAALAGADSNGLQINAAIEPPESDPMPDPGQ